jgi:predicted TPR repeat methyltransferase
MTPNEIAAQLRSNMFAERATIQEAMTYAYELIHTLRPQDRIAAITALHVLTNTIANAITAQETTA